MFLFVNHRIGENSLKLRKPEVRVADWVEWVMNNNAKVNIMWNIRDICSSSSQVWVNMNSKICYLEISHNLHMLKVTTFQFNLLAHILTVICHVITLFCVTVQAANITSTTNINKWRKFSRSFASVTVVLPVLWLRQSILS